MRLGVRSMSRTFTHIPLSSRALFRSSVRQNIIPTPSNYRNETQHPQSPQRQSLDDVLDRHLEGDFQARCTNSRTFSACLSYSRLRASEPISSPFNNQPSTSNAPSSSRISSLPHFLWTPTSFLHRLPAQSINKIICRLSKTTLAWARAAESSPAIGDLSVVMRLGVEQAVEIIPLALTCGPPACPDIAANANAANSITASTAQPVQQVGAALDDQYLTSATATAAAAAAQPTSSAFRKATVRLQIDKRAAPSSNEEEPQRYIIIQIQLTHFLSDCARITP
ncbi:hypothetical protein B0J12DRAFT_787465 [Macrophomina phaseolina]|uniref:Uncharacterized protein n=1 Tax=Macrophomina phaseolina TaxID=35725 RepID=A0ABQ8G3S8_9PEZI|nr:hypothetical protein B0J12DRAFT_787465 [Macrophomina phaseolina]